MFALLIALLVASPSDNPAPTRQHFETCISETATPGDQIQACDTIMQLAPNLAEADVARARVVALYGRAIGYRRLGNFEAAIDALNLLHGLLPDSEDVLVKRGVNHFDRGDFDLALQDFNAALKLNPNSGDAYLERSMTYRNQGDYARAIADYDKALEFLPGDPTVLNNRAWAHYAQGENQVALADIEQAMAIANEHPGVLDTYGHVLAAVGRQEDAVQAFRKAMEHGGASQVAHYQRLLREKHGFVTLRTDGATAEETLTVIVECLDRGCRLNE